MSTTELSHIVDEVLATLHAARTQLEVQAATHLPWPAALRIQRNALIRSRAILSGEYEPRTLFGPIGGRDDATDEILSLALAGGAFARPTAALDLPQAAQIPLDVGPEGVADDTLSFTTDEDYDHTPTAAKPTDELRRLADEAQRLAGDEDEVTDPSLGFVPTQGDTLVTFQDDEPPASVDDELQAQLLAAQRAEEVEAVKAAVAAPSYVSFDDNADAELDDISASVLEQLDAPQPHEGGPDPVIFDDDAVTAVAFTDGINTFDLMPDLADDEADKPDAAPVDAPDNEETLVANLASLVRLQDLLADEDASPTPAKVKPKTKPKAKAKAKPKAKAKAKPKAKTKPKAKPQPDDDAIPLAPDAIEELGLDALDPDLSIDHEDEDDRPPGATATVQIGGPTASVAISAVVPTIRDRKDAPRAAAIQMNAAGTSGQVVGLEEELEPLEMGSAEDFDLVEERDASGLALSVEEYEEVAEYEELDPEEYEEEYEEEPVIMAPVGPSQAELKAMADKGQAAADGGDLDSAVLLFSDVLDADPDFLQAIIGRGRVYLDLGDYARAMSDFTVAEDLAPNEPDTHVAIGDLYFARKDYSRAIEYFNVALGVSPSHAMAFCRRGISHYYRKNFSQALDDLLKAQKLDTDIPNIGTYVAMAKRKKR